jgi:hypothetical protein
MKRDDSSVTRLPTAPVAAAGLIGSFGVAVTSGCRPPRSLILVVSGISCVAIWLRCDGGHAHNAGFLPFVLSHLLR